MHRTLAIDPGTTQSGWCLYYDGKPQDSGVAENEEVLRMIRRHIENYGPVGVIAIEMVASYGMAVGKETFRTVWWTGRFAQVWLASQAPVTLLEVYRGEVKIELCHSMKANDASIRQAIIDMYGGKDAAIGKKATPGPLYGVKSHAWAALAVALTAEARINTLAAA